MEEQVEHFAAPPSDGATAVFGLDGKGLLLIPAPTPQSSNASSHCTSA